MGTVFFLNCFTILNDFCFSWQICPPQQSHCCLLPTQSQPYGVGSSSRAHTLGPHKGSGKRFHVLGWVRPSRDTKVFCKPRHQWERTKEFQGSSSIFQSQAWAPGMPEDAPSSDILSVCPHIACMVPTHQILLFMQLPEFPRPFNLAWMHNDCSVFNDTEHLSIVFLASLLVSTRLFPILDFLLWNFAFVWTLSRKVLLASYLLTQTFDL